MSNIIFGIFLIALGILFICIQFEEELDKKVENVNGYDLSIGEINLPSGFATDNSGKEVRVIKYIFANKKDVK